jgi:hypothetical protein
MISIRKEFVYRIEYHNEQGKRHKEDGPAIEWNDGDFIGEKWWYFNGKRHREDGPAIEYPNGNKEWFLNDTEYSEQDYYHEVAKIKLKRILDL